MNVNICRRSDGTFVELDDGTRIAVLGPEGWVSLDPHWVVDGDLHDIEIGYIEDPRLN
jgi:hypothetical protein